MAQVGGQTGHSATTPRPKRMERVNDMSTNYEPKQEQVEREERAK